jgi:hypothetical protein
MQDKPPQPLTQRKGFVPMAIVVAAAVAGAIAFGAMALVSDDDTSTVTDAGAANGVATHAHEMGDALPGCDQQQMHATMMMFNPSMADELLTGTCPWPYDATIVTAGGAEDPSITATFEPHRYQDIFDMFTSMQVGTCSVNRLADPPTDGFVFGFDIGLRPGGCAEGGATVQLVMREYATRAWRDNAASKAPDDHVYGRWVIEITGEDAAAVEQLGAELAALGAS